MKIFNRKARLQYHILETLEAGIVLSGGEVKSIRLGRVDLNDSFAKLQNGEVMLKNMFIPPYQHASTENYDPKKDRKLLLHKNQIRTLIGKLSKGRMAIVPLSIYVRGNFIKVELALGATKKQFDQRRAIKAKDEQRKLEQELKNY